MKESRISALLDGELKQEEALAVLADPDPDGRLEQDWRLYHLIGDTLRHTSPLSRQFDEKFAARLADEPSIQAPRTIFPRSEEIWNTPQQGYSPPGKLIGFSIAATIVAVSMAGWAVLEPGRDMGLSAKNSSRVQVAGSDQAGPSASAVSGYLTAHQEFSNSQHEPIRYQRASMEKAQGQGQ